jgi:hypothetical protein
MTLPREVVPGRFYLVTRRCTQRQFLLKPSVAANNAFLYCLTEAANRFEIGVILPIAMSNHYHAVVYDRHGTLPQFTEHFHKMLAKTMNALHGRWENLWSSEQVCVVWLRDPEDVMRKLVYTATNPVKDHLVARCHQWPGVNGLIALLKQRPMHAKRPRRFFRPDGRMPEQVTLTLRVPPELGELEVVLRELREQVAAKELEIQSERQRSGTRVLGKVAILRQRCTDVPHSREPRRKLRPQVAARSVWSRIEALARNKAFIASYRAARERWIAGVPAAFPEGTYWLRRFANVPLES